MRGADKQSRYAKRQLSKVRACCDLLGMKSLISGPIARDHIRCVMR